MSQAGTNDSTKREAPNSKMAANRLGETTSSDGPSEVKSTIYAVLFLDYSFQ